ncbi:topoisomerase [Sporosarcina aquimarina]|uniref:topoisomerase n=1 Tax=Sporosarcina aquimarina TaxID=114975 RepID=UPI00203DB2EA|nr:topoisomerase [Sporosarcina aquimarina]MCM3757380.1 topoisomerase [Sporosarcina aquimarina]
MIKRIIMSGVLFSSILLVGCNGEREVVVLEDSENEENDVELSSELNFFAKLKDEILASITKQTKLDRESTAIMIDGTVKEMAVSVSYPKNEKVDETLFQQIVEDSIKKVSETEKATISEENITIKIEKY